MISFYSTYKTLYITHNRIQMLKSISFLYVHITYSSNILVFVYKKMYTFPFIM